MTSGCKYSSILSKKNNNNKKKHSLPKLGIWLQKKKRKKMAGREGWGGGMERLYLARHECEGERTERKKNRKSSVECLAA